MYLNLKVVGAVLLLVSLAFPMQRESNYYKDSEGIVHRQVWGRTPQGATALFESDVYALRSGSWESLMVLLAFAWPVIAVAYWQWRKEAICIVPRALEIVFLFGTSILVYWISIFTILTVTRVGAGGYLAFLGLGFYAVRAIWADVVALREWERRARVPIVEAEDEKSRVVGSTAIRPAGTGLGRAEGQ
jgi:hypothetical protein